MNVGVPSGPMTRRASLTIAAVAVAAVALALSTATAAPATTTTAARTSQPSIVGSWHVDVTGAPYGPHLFDFLPGGVMHTTNPTNVQEVNDVGTHDSVGFGNWEPRPGRSNTYQGTFLQLNADAATDLPVESLMVTWVITIRGDRLTGVAMAGLTTDPSRAPAETRRATFDGFRITTNREMLGTVR